MSSSINFATIQRYLDAVASNANIAIENSPHLAFWTVPYTSFVSGNVPNVADPVDDSPIPIINQSDPLQSAVYLILTDPKGWHGLRQMPAGGPFITDEGYVVTLGDGSTVTGEQISSGLAYWLSNGFPET